MANPKAKVDKIVFHYAGFNAVRKSAGVVADITQRAQRIAATVGPGAEVTITQTPSRVRATIYTDTVEAKTAEAEDKTLSSAIDAGR